MKKEFDDHLIKNVNKMADRLAAMTRTPEDKARAVIANIEQAILFEERRQRTLTGEALSGNKHTVGMLKATIETIRSEFALTRF